MNKRTNVILTLDGISMTQREWAARIRVSDATICKRLKRGWSIEKALTYGAKS